MHRHDDSFRKIARHPYFTFPEICSFIPNQNIPQWILIGFHKYFMTIFRNSYKVIRPSLQSARESESIRAVTRFIAVKQPHATRKSVSTDHPDGIQQF